MKPKNETEKIILGVDPGTQIMGYGVLLVKGNEVTILQFGIIRLSKYAGHELRLKKIFDRIVQIIDEFNPDEMALEAPFYGKNVQSMLKLGRAQGVAMAAALSRDIPITEYMPKKVKQSVTGNGNASKEQVASMMKTLLKFETKPEFLDATDALAVALCHHYSKRSPRGSNSSWVKFLQENPGRVMGDSDQRKPSGK
ncbi:MAG: crossover junction endodeoxyribonuclease RuvC [Cyclobacteriaceae bacterium]|nr:crossover junction endodeoxyribonuclease RuvC [Cyclobacteriaceae bacterium]